MFAKDAKGEATPRRFPSLSRAPSQKLSDFTQKSKPALLLFAGTTKPMPDAAGGLVRLALIARGLEMCRILHMATNLAIDDRLLNEAVRVGGQRTKKDTVTQALQEYVQRRKQAQILNLFGKVDFDPKYNYKQQRRRA
jgi:hypothetical protein